MNNGRFDLKRKLAFVAALAFAANSAGSLSAAGAEAALTAAGSEPATVGVPGDITEQLVYRDSDLDLSLQRAVKPFQLRRYKIRYRFNVFHCRFNS